jgi:hypothetical protein
VQEARDAGLFIRGLAMADDKSLRLIGFGLSAVTAAVTLVAAVLVAGVMPT